MKINIDFNQPSKTNLDYLKRKGFKLTFDYHEIEPLVHKKVFTVAKVMRLDLLNDVYEELYKAQTQGIGFEAFKRNLKPKLMAKGWWGGKVKVNNPKTGEVKEITVGPRRLRTIYRTNENIAVAEQRYKDQITLPLSVYWRYSSLYDNRVRPGHLRIHGVIKHRDDPFWDVNYPPNGWHCRCKVNAYSLKDLDKRGWKINPKNYDTVAHKDWAYNPGKVSRLARLNPPNFDPSLSNLPNLIRKPELDKLGDEQIKNRFYDTLGIQSGDTYIDAVGDPMVIDDSLFTSASGHSKLRKRDRHYYLDELALALSNPDEIWLEYDPKRKQLMKKMIRFYQTKNTLSATMGVFEYLKDKTQGVSLYLAKNPERKRTEKLIYKQKKEEARN